LSKKEKALARLLSKSTDFTWDEALVVMKQHGFTALNGNGSRRKFVHEVTRVKVLIHEPHPEKIIKAYALQLLIDGLRNAGEIA